MKSVIVGCILLAGWLGVVYSYHLAPPAARGRTTTTTPASTTTTVPVEYEAPEVEGPVTTTTTVAPTTTTTKKPAPTRGYGHGYGHGPAPGQHAQPMGYYDSYGQYHYYDSRYYDPYGAYGGQYAQGAYPTQAASPTQAPHPNQRPYGGAQAPYADPYAPQYDPYTGQYTYPANGPQGQASPYYGHAAAAASAAAPAAPRDLKPSGRSALLDSYAIIKPTHAAPPAAPPSSAASHVRAGKWIEMRKATDLRFRSRRKPGQAAGRRRGYPRRPQQQGPRRRRPGARRRNQRRRNGRRRGQRQGANAWGNQQYGITTPGPAYPGVHLATSLNSFAAVNNAPSNGYPNQQGNSQSMQATPYPNVAAAQPQNQNYYTNQGSAYNSAATGTNQQAAPYDANYNTAALPYNTVQGANNYNYDTPAKAVAYNTGGSNSQGTNYNAAANTQAGNNYNSATGTSTGAVGSSSSGTAGAYNTQGYAGYNTGGTAAQAYYNQAAPASNQGSSVDIYGLGQQATAYGTSNAKYNSQPAQTASYDASGGQGQANGYNTQWNGQQNTNWNSAQQSVNPPNTNTAAANTGGSNTQNMAKAMLQMLTGGSNAAAPSGQSQLATRSPPGKAQSPSQGNVPIPRSMEAAIKNAIVNAAKELNKKNAATTAKPAPVVGRREMYQNPPSVQSVASKSAMDPYMITFGVTASPFAWAQVQTTAQQWTQAPPAMPGQNVWSAQSPVVSNNMFNYNVQTTTSSPDGRNIWGSPVVTTPKVSFLGALSRQKVATASTRTPPRTTPNPMRGFQQMLLASALFSRK